MRREVAVPTAAVPAAWSPLDLSPFIFVDADTDFLTYGATVSAATDQGSAGLTFSQATAGMRPTFLEDEWGVGLHGMGFSAGQALVSAAANPSTSVLTLGVVGSLTPAVDYSCMFGCEAAGVSEAYIIGLFGTAALYSIHRTNVGYSQRMGTTVPETAAGIVSRHTITDATEEAKIWVNGTAEDAGNNGNNSNNTTAFGSGAWAIGGRASSLDLFATGKIASVFALGRALTAGELASFAEYALERTGQ